MYLVVIKEVNNSLKVKFWLENPELNKILVDGEQLMYNRLNQVNADVGFV
jgi:hypothetical protein